MLHNRLVGHFLSKNHAFARNLNNPTGVTSYKIDIIDDSAYPDYIFYICKISEIRLSMCLELLVY